VPGSFAVVSVSAAEDAGVNPLLAKAYVTTAVKLAIATIITTTNGYASFLIKINFLTLVFVWFLFGFYLVFVRKFFQFLFGLY
jgi:hypothetical protein